MKGGYRRFGWAAPAMALCAAVLSACGQTAAAPETPPVTAAEAGSHVWFICDGVDVQAIFVANEADASGAFTLTQYEKPSGTRLWEKAFTRGAPDPGAGNVYTPISSADGASGNLHAINPGMLEDPSAAYTEPFVELTLGDQRVTCRWLERTRVMGFTDRRSIVVSEDADGDLIYRSYNFDAPDAMGAIELGGVQRTTRFSTEVRGGSEETGPAGAIFRFEKDGYRYVVGVPESGEATVAVFQGERAVQSERMLAVQTPPRNE